MSNLFRYICYKFYRFSSPGVVFLMVLTIAAGASMIVLNKIEELNGVISDKQIEIDCLKLELGKRDTDLANKYRNSDN